MVIVQVIVKDLAIVMVRIQVIVIVKENFNVIVIVVGFVIVKVIEDFKTLKNWFFLLPLIV